MNPASSDSTEARTSHQNLGELAIRIEGIDEQVYVLHLEGALIGYRPTALAQYIGGYTSQLPVNQFHLIIDFSLLRNASLENAQQTVAAILAWPRLLGMYLVGRHDNFRVAAKLSTAHNPYLAVYWADSAEDALAAIRTDYYDHGRSLAPQPLFRQGFASGRFFELWNLHREVMVLDNKKYRIVSPNNWHLRQSDGKYWLHVSAIDNRVLWLKPGGVFLTQALERLSVLLQQLQAELEHSHAQFFLLMDTSELRLSPLQLFRFFSQTYRWASFGYAHGFLLPPSWKLWRAGLGLSIWLGGRRGAIVDRLDQVLDSNSLQTIKHPTQWEPHSPSSLRRAIRRIENENDILQNNIEVSREKLFHLIAKLLHPSEQAAQVSLDENVFYKDLYQSLEIIRDELTTAWGQTHDKSWQLQKNQERALRSQFDPHFVFNTLNSIRQFILDKNTQKAGAMLNDFADLMRTLMQNSFKTVIDLRSEIEYLKLYTRIEQTRFEHLLDIQFILAAEVEQRLDELNLPPMLLQPFLEQAIWERVLPNKHTAELGLHFDLKDEWLQCRIQANGLSFDQAQRSPNDFKAERTKRINDLEARLKLLHEMYECRIEIFRIETRNPNAQNTVTEILIEVPQNCF